jgi:hypothetical protein
MSSRWFFSRSRFDFFAKKKEKIGFDFFGVKKEERNNSRGWKITERGGKDTFPKQNKKNWEKVRSYFHPIKFK